MDFLKKDAGTAILFVLVSATDNQTEISGVSPTCTICKAGAGGYSACDNAPTSLGNGTYRLVISSDETDTEGFIIVRAEYSGAATVRREYYVGDLTALHGTELAVGLSYDAEKSVADTVWRRDLGQSAIASGRDALSRYTGLAGIMALTGVVTDTDGLITLKTPAGATLDTFNVTTDSNAELAVGRT